MKLTAGPDFNRWMKFLFGCLVIALLVCGCKTNSTIRAERLALKISSPTASGVRSGSGPDQFDAAKNKKAIRWMEGSNDIEDMKIVRINVDASTVIHTMKGGMGASWHAISKELPLHNEKYRIPAREIGSRGSAWGGNPPVSYEVAWKQLKAHASWLGMNFVRVELSQRMYEPGRDKYSWENEEMKALYNILDWAEANGVDVFLQQMWSNVDWNAIPGIHPLISAPRELDDFAKGIATMVEFLAKEKHYTCIKYFCMTNEPPGGTWGYWWEYGKEKGSIGEAWERLYKEFRERGIKIPISGPDWTDMPPFDEDELSFAAYFGAIDIHSYHGVTQEGEQNLREWADWAHAHGKPFFLSEYGNMNLGWGGDDPHQKTFDAAISNACDVIRGMRAGVDAFNRWSFTNRGDLDGQWQLVRTYDRENKRYFTEVLPETEAYYGFGIISRFLSKYSSVSGCSVSVPDTMVMSTALLSPGGQLTIPIVNLSPEAIQVQLEIMGFEERTVHLYQASSALVHGAGYRMEPLRSFQDLQQVHMTLPPRSITTLSSVALSSDERGIIIN